MEKKWKETNKRFIAFLDIMGFKELVNNTPHENIYNDLKKLIEGINSIKDAINDIGLPEKRYCHLESATFSDSIILTSNDDSKDSFISISFVVSSIMAKAFSLGIPLKGALSVGELTIDTKNSIYFGKPLIKAYLLQEDLKIYGLILDDSVEALKYSSIDDYYTIYKTPFKTGKISHYMLNWYSSGWYKPGTRKDPKDMYLTVSGTPRVYVDNTIDYINWFINNEELTSR